jgi:SAM-dependent methyltransferase
MSFQDHFSAHAGAYARFRPSYPLSLFAWLAGLVPSRALAWDCGTGSGQAAVALAEHFERVIASDASSAQLAHAAPHARVLYRVAPAETPPPEARGADLVTVAQALHWFDLERFYPAVRRLLAPDGVIAAWGYGLMHISPAVDAVVADYYHNIVGRCWPPDRAHIENRYLTLSFPFQEIAAPEFSMTADWTLDMLLGYLDTWSATRRYLAAHDRHPLDQVVAALRDAWGDAEQRTVTWPLFLRVGRRA